MVFEFIIYKFINFIITYIKKSKIASVSKYNRCPNYEKNVSKIILLMMEQIKLQTECINKDEESLHLLPFGDLRFNFVSL